MIETEPFKMSTCVRSGIIGKVCKVRTIVLKKRITKI